MQTLTMQDTAFHTYSVVWTPTLMTFYVDGAPYYSVNNSVWWSGSAPGSTSAPFDKPFYILLNLAVGGWREKQKGEACHTVVLVGGGCSRAKTSLS